ncbi:MAG: aldo/keto reductase [Chloroflexi bacterium]|nr:aldo/keto reductase [Chloroflexota bacterium]
MQYRQLGRSGTRVSVIGLGTNRFGTDAVSQETVDNIIAAAQERGVNFIDTANVYQQGKSEERLGIALKGRWDKFVVATKFVFSMGEGVNDRGASRYHMLNALDASLRRLQTDHIDLYYVHGWDEQTPIEETLRALDDAVRMGKVRYVGASQFAAWQLAYSNLLAEMRGWSPFVVSTAHYHMFERLVEHEMLPYCRAHRVGLVPFFPLAGGFLTGKYQRGEPAPAGSRGESSPYVQKYMTAAYFTQLEKLTTWVDAHGHTMSQLAHAWLLAQSSVCSVISGATRLDQFLANVEAGDWSLTESEAKEVNEILGVATK